MRRLVPEIVQIEPILNFEVMLVDAKAMKYWHLLPSS
jgi:hypothetical protein